jgi:gamma-tubulin complex component 5
VSQTPTAETLSRAETILSQIDNPTAKPVELTWKDIVGDEPFEGEHWRGVYGMPPGSVKLPESGDNSGSDSDLSLSSFDSEDPDTQSDILSPGPASPHVEAVTQNISPPRPTIPPSSTGHSYRHRGEVEALQASQYWRPEWTVPDTAGSLTHSFDVGDPYTLGPSFSRQLARQLPPAVTDAHVPSEVSA